MNYDERENFVPPTAVHNRRFDITVTKTVEFAMAHRLYPYDGPCSNVHGHNYKLEVTLGSQLQPKDMVVDFSDIKKTINKTIMNEWDHALVLSEDDPFLDALRDVSMPDMRIKAFGEGMVTAENMAYVAWKMITERLPKGIYCDAVTIWETSTSFATYRIKG